MGPSCDTDDEESERSCKPRGRCASSRRTRAGTLAGAVPGVVALDSDLRVAEARVGVDRRIATYLEQRLRWSPFLDGGDVEVTFTPDAIYLDGVVESQASRLDAQQIVEDVSMKPVVNRIRVE